MESLEFWSARLQDHIDTLNLGMEQTQNLRDRCVDRIVDYSPPDGEHLFENKILFKGYYYYYFLKLY